MKKIVAIILCFVCLFGFNICAGAESSSDDLYPTTDAAWMLIESVNVTFFVSANGIANVTYSITANISPVDVTVYVEKKTSLFGWSQIGEAESLRSEKRYITGSYSVPVDSEGEYRAVLIAVPKYESEKVKKTVNFSYDKSIFIGDVNSDGKVNAVDARLALRFSARLEKYTEAQKKICDVNGDKKITSADARYILRISAKLD